MSPGFRKSPTYNKIIPTKLKYSHPLTETAWSLQRMLLWLPFYQVVLPKEKVNDILRQNKKNRDRKNKVLD